jgi:hypothetical protein
MDCFLSCLFFLHCVFHLVASFPSLSSRSCSCSSLRPLRLLSAPLSVLSLSTTKQFGFRGTTSQRFLHCVLAHSKTPSSQRPSVVSDEAHQAHQGTTYHPCPKVRSLFACVCLMLVGMMCMSSVFHPTSCDCSVLLYVRCVCFAWYGKVVF